MDFSLNEAQRAWQLKARKFAAGEIRSLSLQRDQIGDPRATFDWKSSGRVRGWDFEPPEYPASGRGRP